MTNLSDGLSNLAIVLTADVSPSQAQEIEFEIQRFCLGLMTVDGKPNEHSEILYFGKTTSRGEFIVLVRPTLSSSWLPDANASCDIIQLLCKIDGSYIRVSRQFLFKPETL
jgi:hypothetical protein